MSIVTLADPLVNGEEDLNTDQSYLYMVLLQRKSDRGFKEKDILVSPWLSPIELAVCVNLNSQL